MLKISKIKPIALASALTLSTLSMAQNIPQNSYDSLMSAEFKKADINPKDYYISQEELNEYMQKNMDISNFDSNNDRKLNIDKFKSTVKNNINSNKQENKKSINSIGHIFMGLATVGIALIALLIHRHIKENSL